MSNYPKTIIYGGGIRLEHVRDEHYSLPINHNSTYLFSNLMSNDERTIKALVEDVLRSALTTVTISACERYGGENVIVDTLHRMVIVGKDHYKIDGFIIDDELRVFVYFHADKTIAPIDSLTVLPKDDSIKLIADFVKAAPRFNKGDYSGSDIAVKNNETYNANIKTTKPANEEEDIV